MSWSVCSAFYWWIVVLNFHRERDPVLPVPVVTLPGGTALNSQSGSLRLYITEKSGVEKAA